MQVSLSTLLQKARTKKYIRRWKGRDGKWRYIYKEPEKRVKQTNYEQFSGGIDKIVNENNLDFGLYALHFSSDKIEDFSIVNRSAVYFFEHPKEEMKYSDFPLESFDKNDKEDMVEDETGYDPTMHVGWYYGNYANLVKLNSNSKKILDLRNEKNYKWLVQNVNDFKNFNVEDDETEIEELIGSFYDNEREKEINEMARKNGFDIVLYSDSSEGTPFTALAVVNPDIIKTSIKKAGTFSGHKLHKRRRFMGMNISVENRKGSYRHWKDDQGNEGKTKMLYDYGYIRGTEGRDGDHVDVFLGANENAPFAFVVHQNRPDNGKYDEDKIMLGFDTAEDAKRAYLKHYDSIKFFGGMKAMSIDKFKERVYKTLHGKKKSLKTELHKAFTQSRVKIRRKVL